MPATNFDKVVELAQALNDAEKWRLRDLLDIWLEPPGPQMTEEEVAQEMLRMGILDQVPPPIADTTPYEKRELIEIQGEPLSETVMKERREVAGLFFDTSAVVKRYVRETGSLWVNSLTAPGTRNVAYIVRITAVEVASAVARRIRGGSLTPAAGARVLAYFRRDYVNEYQLVGVTPRLVLSAMTLAEAHGLRGYDAAQLAAALRADAQRRRRRLSALTFISADTNLLAAATVEGLAVEDPNAHP